MLRQSLSLHLLLLSSRPHLLVESSIRHLEATKSTQTDGDNGTHDNHGNEAHENAWDHG